jgi:predicted N-acetyltransferase YhbS
VTVEYRPALPLDWPSIGRIVRAWDSLDASVETPKGELVWRVTESAQQSEHAIPSLSMVAVDDREVIAFAGIYRVPLIGFLNGPRTALYMSPLVVTGPSRHQGVAVGLVRAVHARLADILRQGLLEVAPFLVWEGSEQYTFERFGCVPGADLGIEPPRATLEERSWHAIALLFTEAENREVLSEPRTSWRGRIETPPLFDILDEQVPAD